MKDFEAKRCSSHPESPADLRTRAGHVRQHAWDFADDVAAPRMHELANELDAQATALETGPVATRLGKGWRIFS
jgi:hypothetical protein